jgi:glycosyltransferase involved in cell wall biosynthesis
VLTVAYLANQFPAAVEPYVSEEIQELRKRGVKVIPGSVRRPDAAMLGSRNAPGAEDILCLQPICGLIAFRALGLAVRRRQKISGLLSRVLFQGKESPIRRVKALLHTWLGAYYAVLLRERGVDHIHVHHGYFGSWIGMVAARLLDAGFSLTLHGSDLLVHGAYLDTKLESCRFCVTISEFNRRYILEHYPGLEPAKIMVSRLGVDEPRVAFQLEGTRGGQHTFTLLSVGRLHAVKDHAFLVRACARLRDRGMRFECLIAGEGPEREPLESLIRNNGLQERVRLLGHIDRQRMDSLYAHADAVVLTSRSEGIPLVLMEAMIRSRVVVAPAITGIPEIIIPGKTGFLYEPGDLQDFVNRILFLETLLHSEDRDARSALHWIRHAARVYVLHNFGRRENLNQFSNQFLQRIATEDRSSFHEDFVLQQI